MIFFVETFFVTSCKIHGILVVSLTFTQEYKSANTKSQFSTLPNCGLKAQACDASKAECCTNARLKNI